MKGARATRKPKAPGDSRIFKSSDSRIFKSSDSRIFKSSDSRIFKMDLPDRGGPALCLVADSPHSGTVYPADFNYACDLHELRKAEDSYVDKLFDFLPQLGIPFLQAQFPRSYVDPNRGDAVTAKYKAQGDGPYMPTQEGMVRRKCTPRSKHEVYDRPLSLKEVFNRVATYHKPYHARLKALADAARRRHGRVVHLNCHSMPGLLHGGTVSNAHDVIIGTRWGTTCDPAVAEKLKELFTAKGYRTGTNIPGFSGAEIVRRIGRPDDARHSIQIELNRKLYMDEDTLQMLPAAQKLKDDLKDIVRDFAAWCEQNVAPGPAGKKPSGAAKRGGPSA